VCRAGVRNPAASNAYGGTCIESARRYQSEVTLLRYASVAALTAAVCFSLTAAIGSASPDRNIDGVSYKMLPWDDVDFVGTNVKCEYMPATLTGTRGLLCNPRGKTTRMSVWIGGGVVEISDDAKRDVVFRFRWS
jgi:hypothetical protein